jgi:hypothetical protein
MEGGTETGRDGLAAENLGDGCGFIIQKSFKSSIFLLRVRSKLYPIFLEEDVRNIRGRNIVHPASPR